MKTLYLPGILVWALALSCCKAQPDQKEAVNSPFLAILGNIQDGGSPHIGCSRDCCKDLFSHPAPDRMVVSLGLIDPANKKNWLIEATPDMPGQLRALRDLSPFSHGAAPDGIFVTHAHIGHYTGLMYLGREALGADKVPVYVMPRMRRFIENNQPWKQLVSFNNIALRKLENEQPVAIAEHIEITPRFVPHRDELSETVGYKITGPHKSVLFIPDINKWGVWDKHIIDEIKLVDYAFLDATFYDAAEIGYRDISEIPHPFVIESMELFKDLPAREKDKIYFIHLNHTNPLLNPGSKQYKEVIDNGFHVAQYGEKFSL